MDGNLVTGARLRLESDMTCARSEVQHDRTLAVEELGRKLVGHKFFARERTGVLDCGHSRSRRYALASHAFATFPSRTRGSKIAPGSGASSPFQLSGYYAIQVDLGIFERDDTCSASQPHGLEKAGYYRTGEPDLLWKPSQITRVI
jgi:hypothetical protein